MNQGRMRPILLSMVLMTCNGALAKSKMPNRPSAVPGEYVVKLKNNNMAVLSNVYLESVLKAQVVERLSPASNAILVRRPLVEKTSSGIKALLSNKLVERAEPNYLYYVVGGTSELPNDPELGKLWGLINTGQKSVGDMGEIESKPGIDIDVQRAWQLETGNRDVVVASIDTGVDYSLPDLAENMWVNEVEKNGLPNVDDDGNGVLDDVYGFNAIKNNGDTKDDHGHGSHTSGTIAARGNDGLGLVGVAWNTRVMSVKFLSASGSGTLADAIKAIDYTTQMKVTMTTNSWSGGNFSQELYDSIKRARDAGILFVAAAGNDSADNDSTPGYPASYDLDNIISVAAIDSRGELAEFSSYGKTSVDVAAPGVNVLSTTPNGLVSWSGTSMATPHVTGVAVLLKSAFPEMTYSDIKARIIKTARPLSSLRGKMVSSGLVNAYYALTDTPAPLDPEDPINWQKVTAEASTPHPYANLYKNSWTLHVDGAVKLSLHFSKFRTEASYDRVTFKDANGKVFGSWSGKKDDSFSPVVVGDTVVVEFLSDDTVNEYGFDVDAIAYQ
ncbi:MAG: S8 family serine peptidase [Bdellovibrionales bacterium]|nr:S8 family serine peptidase [Bdellovibrionales bacterium]